MSELERIACCNFIETDGYAYFSNHYYNGFFMVEIETGRTVFWGCFAEEKVSQRRIHKEIFLRDKKIYICPWAGRYVHIWNLADQTMCSVEIRMKDERFFLIDEVILGENCVYFLPDKKENPVKKMNLESLKVTELKEKSEMKGTYISGSKDIFPEPELIKKWQIKYADQFFWRHISNNVWYGFLPLGNHMLRYVEGKDKLEIIPLTVVNKRRLEEHLHRIRVELLGESQVSENVINFQEFLNEVKIGEIYKSEYFRGNGNIGKKIWKLVKSEY